MEHKVTIRDVAKQAGVSVASVSYAINDIDKINSETRERILKVIEEMKYKPSLTARCLSNGNSRLIGITLPLTESGDAPGMLLKNPFFGEFISGVESITRKEGYDILFTGVETDEQCRDWIQRRKLDGIIMLGMYPKSFFVEVKKLGIPIVLTDAYEDYAKEFHRVMLEDEIGSYQAVRYLLEKGHRKIAFVTGSIEHSPLNRKRYQGYQRALQEAGIEVKPEYFLEYPVSFQGGYQAAMEIMQTKCDVTAIFAIADIMAIGMLKAFRENGREVPQDYSIIGFDDIQFDEYVTPGLTTMHQDSAQKGKISAEIILEDVKHGCSKGKTVVLKPTLVERESVRQW